MTIGFGFRRFERGYNLIEVIVAMGMMSTLLLAVITLFFFGRGNVYSGKMMTQGVAIGTDALEDLSAQSVQGIYTAFLINSATPLGTYTIDGVTYTNAIIRSTDPTIVASPPAQISSENVPTGGTGMLTSWRNNITTTRKMARGSVTVIMRPRQPTAVMAGTSPAPRVMQVRVIVRWVESRRERHVEFDTVRYRR